MSLRYFTSFQSFDDAVAVSIQHFEENFFPSLLHVCHFCTWCTLSPDVNTSWSGFITFFSSALSVRILKAYYSLSGLSKFLLSRLHKKLQSDELECNLRFFCVTETSILRTYLFELCILSSEVEWTFYMTFFIPLPIFSCSWTESNWLITRVCHFYLASQKIQIYFFPWRKKQRKRMSTVRRRLKIRRWVDRILTHQVIYTPQIRLHSCNDSMNRAKLIQACLISEQIKS